MNLNSPGWHRAIETALEQHRDVPQATYVQLATLRADGRPSVRTLVFRGFLSDSVVLQFVTDVRSAKAEPIDRQPWAEACWYFPETREQFRFSGRLTLVRADHPQAQLREARRDLWRSLSDPVRRSFHWPAPGEPRAEASAFQTDSPDPNSPPPSFGLLLLVPDRVDCLNLRPNPHDRMVWSLDSKSGWSSQPINP